MLNNVKSAYTLNKPRSPMFLRYNYYICTVFFHGIRFKVKDKLKQAVVRQPVFPYSKPWRRKNSARFSDCQNFCMSTRWR